jgi:hypothetical protein
MKVTFPISHQLDGDLFIKHTYGDVRRFVKSILKISDLTQNVSAYKRHLNKMWATVDALEQSFKAQKRRWTGTNLPDTNCPFYKAAAYQRELSEHAEEISMLRVMLRGIDITDCNPVEKAQVSLLRFAIQDDGFYMPQAKETIDGLLRSAE